jgi:hypothetical protein
MLSANQNKKITEMTGQEILVERKLLRAYIDDCQFESPLQVEQYFEAITMLIWKHKMVGLIYACYYDAMANKRDGGADLEGSDQVVYDTLATLAKIPDILPIFCEIHAIGTPETGYRFGQAVWNEGSAKGGVSEFGPGGDGAFEPYEFLEMCECMVKFAEGKWRMVGEWGVRSAAGLRRVVSQRTCGE